MSSWFVGVPVSPIRSTSMDSKVLSNGLLGCTGRQQRIDAPYVHVVFVLNAITDDSNWVPIRIEDRAYLILDCEPGTTVRLNAGKFTASNEPQTVNWEVDTEISDGTTLREGD